MRRRPIAPAAACLVAVTIACGGAGPVRRPAMAASRQAAQARGVRWDRLLDQPAAWYGSAEAARIADNVVLYQRRSGGWPKDVDMTRPLGASARAGVAADKVRTDSTIDNGATVTEMRFLARVHVATPRAVLKAAFLDGLDFLLAAQYPNGGWPQFFPLRSDYSRHITFNDDAMVRVMTVLQEVAAAAPPFGFVDAARRSRASAAVDRAIRTLVATQVKVGGTLTAWCAQHDEVTLAPRGARTYEHASLSGRETVGIVRFLMGVEDPGPGVVAAIDSAVAWLRSVRIDGQRLVRKDAATPLGFDEVLVADTGAPSLWARFYEIGTNRPIFSGRDGIVKYTLAEIDYERRTGYSWIGPYAADLLERHYPAWRATRC